MKLVPPGTAEARTSYGISVRLSVCPSVTTRYEFNARWDRDSGSSPYDSLEYLVSYEVTWCHSLMRFPSNEGIKEGYPPLEIVILPLLAHLAWKRLQIDTDLLLIITSTADELSSGTNIDDLERPWTPKIGVYSEFLAIFGCNTHFKTEWIAWIAPKPLKIDQDNLHTKCSALNVDFSGVRCDP